MATRGDTGAAQEKQSLCSADRERQLGQLRVSVGAGSQGRGHPGHGLTQAGGAEREGGPVSTCLSWGSGVYTEVGVSGFHLEHLSVTGSQRARGGLVTGTSLITWLGWSSGWGAHSLFVGMLRQQENVKFKRLQYSEPCDVSASLTVLTDGYRLPPGL